MTLRDELLGRIGDAVRKCERGEISAVDFLTPTDAADAAEQLRREPVGLAWKLYGGYPEAERCMLFFLPDYIKEWNPSYADEFIKGVRIVGSGYEKLSHRAFMGSMLGLGIAREAVGDIITKGEYEAVVFAKLAVTRFLLSAEQPLTRVGRDTVHIVPYDGDGSELIRGFIVVLGVVSSVRFDCVVAELCNLSREKAKLFIQSGEAQLNYAEADVSDCVSEGDVLSVRGRGKFKIISIGSRTKKDRLRIQANKYL